MEDWTFLNTTFNVNNNTEVNQQKEDTSIYNSTNEMIIKLISSPNHHDDSSYDRDIVRKELWIQYPAAILLAFIFVGALSIWTWRMRKGQLNRRKNFVSLSNEA
uniref:Uncharacterized protein n=1 Tax=Parastrongyloides trichosuri TaxID=131310 RepID=A0A0N4ZJ29_PARTI